MGERGGLGGGYGRSIVYLGIIDSFLHDLSYLHESLSHLHVAILSHAA